MLNLLATVALLTSPSPALISNAPTSTALQEVDVRAAFVALHAKNDAAGCEKLFREHPGDVLETIDADLEGSLAVWEKNPEAPDQQAIAEQQVRALWGAKLATKVSGDPIFTDYTSAFIGWTPEQRRQFRGGQAAFGRSRKALKAGEHDNAAAAARECVELAAPLGDWWGQAMGLSALGQVLAAQQKHAEAVTPLSQAALIYRQLQRVGDEYNAIRTLAGALRSSGALRRAHAALERAAELAQRLGDERGKTTIEAQLAELAKEIGELK